MRLAEALQERADIIRSIDQLRSRLSSNALVQEGKQAVEDPLKLKQTLYSSSSMATREGAISNLHFDIAPF